MRTTGVGYLNNDSCYKNARRADGNGAAEGVSIGKLGDVLSGSPVIVEPGAYLVIIAGAVMIGNHNIQFFIKCTKFSDLSKTMR